jgi:hypothetical protein
MRVYVNEEVLAEKSSAYMRSVYRIKNKVAESLDRNLLFVVNDSKSDTNQPKTSKPPSLR